MAQLDPNPFWAEQRKGSESDINESAFNSVFAYLPVIGSKYVAFYLRLRSVRCD
ncbi:hypothetical protein LguiA_035865 [Lonicera macranthoides]